MQLIVGAGGFFYLPFCSFSLKCSLKPKPLYRKNQNRNVNPVVLFVKFLGAHTPATAGDFEGGPGALRGSWVEEAQGTQGHSRAVFFSFIHDIYAFKFNLHTLGTACVGHPKFQRVGWPGSAALPAGAEVCPYFNSIDKLCAWGAHPPTPILPLLPQTLLPAFHGIQGGVGSSWAMCWPCQGPAKALRAMLKQISLA